MTPTNLRHDGTVIRYDASVVELMEPKLFDAAWLQASEIWQGSSTGRSKAHFFHYAGRDMVLRHFHRGGLVGRFNRDLYLRVRAEDSRPFREFDLLCEMHADGLPVPLPVAAQYVPSGAFYRAALITQRIPDARPFQDVLREAIPASSLWLAIGANIRKLHNHGIYHSDLNCRNILIDTSARVWFIDFDKCEKRMPGAWEQATLERLKRSLRKLTNEDENVQWPEEGWTDLLAGYTNETAHPD